MVVPARLAGLLVIKLCIIQITCLTDVKQARVDAVQITLNKRHSGCWTVSCVEACRVGVVPAINAIAWVFLSLSYMYVGDASGKFYYLHDLQLCDEQRLCVQLSAQSIKVNLQSRSSISLSVCLSVELCQFFNQHQSSNFTHSLFNEVAFQFVYIYPLKPTY